MRTLACCKNGERPTCSLCNVCCTLTQCVDRAATLQQELDDIRGQATAYSSQVMTFQRNEQDLHSRLATKDNLITEVPALSVHGLLASLPSCFLASYDCMGTLYVNDVCMTCAQLQQARTRLENELSDVHRDQSSLIRSLEV